MSELDKKQIDHLYTLLRRAETEKDIDAAAALRWAIFNLEQQGREKQTGDLVYRLAFTSEAEINGIMDTGAFNEIIKGYLVTAMRDAGAEIGSIRQAADALDSIFDDTDAAAARKAYREL